MGKAKHPHDASRPTPKGVLRAIEKQDAKTLKLALTPRQRRFAEEYIVDFNATAAAIRAGYATTYADRQGHLLTKHEGIAAYIDMLTASTAAKAVAIDPDYVLQEVTKIITKEGTRDGDKLRALELIARHLGMFVDRTEITGKDGGAIQTEEIRQESEDFKRQIDAMSRKGLKVVK